MRRNRRIWAVAALVVAVSLGTAVAGAQTRTWGRLTTNSGPAPYDWEIAHWIDQYFEDGNKGDGVVTSNIIYIETQCFEEGADNFNAVTGEGTGDAGTDTVSFTNTTYMAGQAPGKTSFYRGYHDDAAFALLPGLTAGQVHSFGAMGRDSRETPRIQGDGSRKVGGTSSTHVLVWAGQPNSLDETDVTHIVLNFEDHPNTTVDVLYGDGSTGFGSAVNSVGAATKANLRAKLQQIGQLMDDGPDEQFIFFITDHGSSPKISQTPVTVGNGNSVLVDISVSGALLDSMVSTPESLPTVTFASPDDLTTLGSSVVGFDLGGSIFFGYAEQAVQGTLEIPDLGSYSTYTFAIDKELLQGLKQAQSSGATLSFGISNFSSQPVQIDYVIFDPGDLAKEDGSEDREVLAAAAKAPGSGADFVTRWDLANLLPRPVDLDLVFTPREDQGGSSVSTSVTLQPGALIETEDPLADFFGISTGSAIGAVDIRPEAGAAGGVAINSTISARLGSGEEYGQFFPVMDAADAIAAGSSVYFTTTHDAGRYRVNAGAMALQDGTRVLVQPVDPQNLPLATAQALDLDSSRSAQLNDLGALFGLGSRSDYMVKMQVQTGSAVGYVSVLDGFGGNGTSDPTTILAERSSPDRVVLLELGSIQGLNEFAGSANLVNFGSSTAQVRADFYQRGTPGVKATATVSIPGRSARGYADFVGDVFGITGQVGTVVLTPLSGGPISATAREFAVFRDGTEVTGTAGQRIPGLLEEDMLTPGVIWHFVGLRQRQTSEGMERSHIAVFNPGSADVEVTLRLYSEGTGGPDGSLTRTVRAGELIQINNVVGELDPDQDGGVRRLELETTGEVFAEVFRVNPTGDPITIDAR